MEIDPTLLKIMLNSFSYVLCVLGPTFLKNLHLGLSAEVASSRFGSVVYVFSRHKIVVINDSFSLFEYERMRFTPVCLSKDLPAKKFLHYHMIICI